MESDSDSNDTVYKPKHKATRCGHIEARMPRDNAFTS